MESPDGLYQAYIDIWRPILTGWLGWSEDRFAAWTAGWDYAIRNVDAHRTWFYHEDELHHVLRLLVPDELAHRLEKQRTRRMYNDLAELMYEELQTAIAGRPVDDSWRTDAFDWGAAKRRVGIVLEHYGASLPTPADVSSYERRIRDAYTI
jgi:hypothetical protein